MATKKGKDDLLPFGLPAIYDDLQDILEQFLQDSSKLPIYSVSFELNDCGPSTVCAPLPKQFE
jgi:hypothetical protein